MVLKSGSCQGEGSAMMPLCAFTMQLKELSGSETASCRVREASSCGDPGVLLSPTACTGSREHSRTLKWNCRPVYKLPYILFIGQLDKQTFSNFTLIYTLWFCLFFSFPVFFAYTWIQLFQSLFLELIKLELNAKAIFHVQFLFQYTA